MLGTQFPSFSGEDHKLIKAAAKAKEKAHAPYSGIKLGAALLTDRGEVCAGCNVENALCHAEQMGRSSLAGYHSIHAEESAVVAMILKGAKRIQKVITVTDLPEPVMPCSLCAQVLNEFANGDPIVIGVSSRGKICSARLSSLL